MYYVKLKQIRTSGFDCGLFKNQLRNQYSRDSRQFLYIIVTPYIYVKISNIHTIYSLVLLEFENEFLHSLNIRKILISFDEYNTLLMIRESKNIFTGWMFFITFYYLWTMQVLAFMTIEHCCWSLIIQ